MKARGVPEQLIVGELAPREPSTFPTRTSAHRQDRSGPDRREAHREPRQVGRSPCRWGGAGRRAGAERTDTFAGVMSEVVPMVLPLSFARRRRVNADDIPLASSDHPSRSVDPILITRQPSAFNLLSKCALNYLE